jgi:hypothetical protein
MLQHSFKKLLSIYFRQYNFSTDVRHHDLESRFP